eukprot:407000_1
MYHDEPRYSTFIIITWHRLEAILAQILSFKSSHKSSQNYMKRIDTDQNHHHHLKRHTHARITAIIGEYHALYEDRMMRRFTGFNKDRGCVFALFSGAHWNIISNGITEYPQVCLLGSNISQEVVPLLCMHCREVIGDKYWYCDGDACFHCIHDECMEEELGSESWDRLMGGDDCLTLCRDCNITNNWIIQDIIQ